MPKLMEERIRQVPKKCTIMKPRIGCVKTTAYNLPAADHTYGYSPPSDAEGAGDILSYWVTANPSTGKESTTSHVHQNILAIKNGCITATSMRKYIKEHPNIRLKEVLATDSGRQDAMIEGPFGRKTEYGDENVKNLIEGCFTNYNTDDTDYPVLKGFVMHGFMPAPVSTKSSELLQRHIKAKQEKASAPEKRFVMKRFQNIPPTFKLPK